MVAHSRVIVATDAKAVIRCAVFARPMHAVRSFAAARARALIAPCAYMANRRSVKQCLTACVHKPPFCSKECHFRGQYPGPSQCVAKHSRAMSGHTPVAQRTPESTMSLTIWQLLPMRLL